MAQDVAVAAERAADELAVVRPTGQIRIVGALLDVLYARIADAGTDDPAIPRAVAEGDRVVSALDAGCPPQFHPGVPPDHEKVLRELRTRLGLDRADAVELAENTDPRYVRVLRAIGCLVVRSEGPPPSV